MKTVKTELCGRTQHLCLNGAALFDIYDKFGTAGFLTEPIRGETREAFHATCWVFAKLAEQGELVRRHMGHDKSPILPPEHYMTAFRPADVLVARQAIEAAVRLGFAREEDGEDEVDLGLMELEAQKKNGDRLSRSRYLQIVTQFLGLSVPDGLLLTPGQVADLQELEIVRRGLRRKEAED